MVFRELSVIEVKEIWHGQRAQLRGPVRARLRSVLARRFARDLLACPAATLDLSAILDGGMLIARRPSGQIGEDTARLVTAAVRVVGRRHPPAHLPPEQCRDATIIVDECRSFLHLAVGMDEALAEARGATGSLSCWSTNTSPNSPTSGTCRGQRPQQDLFHLSPADAHHLARHTAPRVRRRGPRGPARVSRHRACAAPWPGRAVVLDRYPPAGTISGAGRADPAPLPASRPASPSPGVATPDNTTTHRRRQRHRPWPWPGSGEAIAEPRQLFDDRGDSPDFRRSQAHEGLIVGV